ncbi:MAG: VOC family protein [Anaerolineae bacterium]|jgi:prepilin-type processing-associated H-X9-DG protein|nr:VOC family protein [Chloroflexota bacterium]
MDKVITCLWFDGHVEEALELYTSLLPDAHVLEIARYASDAQGMAGQVLSGRFRLAGQDFLLINGGPAFPQSEAVSLQILCDTQEEIDRLWATLLEGGKASQCGWLKDRFGVSWQITPRALGPMLADADPERARRVTEAMLGMVKLDIAALERAYG